MPQTKPIYEEIKECNSIIKKWIEKDPERFGGIVADKIIAYGIINKSRPEKKVKVYEMSGAKEPESFTNSKNYFIEVYMDDWNSRPIGNKNRLVESMLLRIDTEKPGKVAPYDYRDLKGMVEKYGHDWEDRDDLPDPLRD